MVNWTRVTVSEARPDDWQYLQGALFVVILAFRPRRLCRHAHLGVGTAPSPPATGLRRAQRHRIVLEEVPA
ncbi:MAG: hypothetical protein R2755_16785 [Acidimicrobiales bacterium]